jgi:LysR family transcriptional regulator for bpeEF and oprC
MEDLNGLRVFAHVAEARSFSEAGRRLGLTSSAVSKAISRMERELGVRLLNRSTRHVGLTSDGLDFYERCHRLLSDLDDAEALVTRSATIPRGRLRVYVPTEFGRRVVLPALAQMIERYPDLVIDVELGVPPPNPFDKGFDAVIHFGPVPDSSYIARKLCDVRFLVCASPRYLERHGVPLTPDDLDDHICLGYETPWNRHYREWSFAHQGEVFSRQVSGRLNVNDAQSLLEAAVADVGIAMMSAFVAYDAVRAGALRVVLQDFIAPGLPFSVLYMQGRQSLPRLRWFLDVLQDMIPSPAPWDDILSR